MRHRPLSGAPGLARESANHLHVRCVRDALAVSSPAHAVLTAVGTRHLLRQCRRWLLCGRSLGPRQRRRHGRLSAPVAPLSQARRPSSLFHLCLQHCLLIAEVGRQLRVPVQLSCLLERSIRHQDSDHEEQPPGNALAVREAAPDGGAQAHPHPGPRFRPADGSVADGLRAGGLQRGHSACDARYAMTSRTSSCRMIDGSPSLIYYLYMYEYKLRLHCIYTSHMYIGRLVYT